MLEYKSSCEVLKIFAQEYSNDYLGLTLIFYGKVRFAFWAFMDFVEDFGAKVNKYS